MRMKNISLLFLCLFTAAGCAAKGPAAAPPVPLAMPFTPENVSVCRAAVEKARRGGPASATAADYVRYVRAVYVAPLPDEWSVPRTVAAAMARAKKDGGREAAEFLRLTVYDVQLLSALEGRVFSRREWRDIYVRSGLMTQASFNILFPPPKIPPPPEVRPSYALEGEDGPGGRLP